MIWASVYSFGLDGVIFIRGAMHSTIWSLCQDIMSSPRISLDGYNHENSSQVNQPWCFAWECGAPYLAPRWPCDNKTRCCAVAVQDGAVNEVRRTDAETKFEKKPDGLLLTDRWDVMWLGRLDRSMKQAANRSPNDEADFMPKSFGYKGGGLCSLASDREPNDDLISLII